MGMRYEWAHSSNYAGIAAPVELNELGEDGNDGGDYGIAFVTGSDGCMIHGSLEGLTSMARRILADLERSQTTEHLYRKCRECHLFVEPNSSHGDYPGLAEYVHLAREDETDEELDASHEAVPSGEGHTLDYWRANGPAKMRARFFIPVWLAEGEGDVIVINDVNDMRDNFDDAREVGAAPADMGFEDYCDGWVQADMPAELTDDEAQEWAARQL